MVNTIVICPDGHMIPESDCLGRTGEHKATVLRFEFFKDLNGEAVAELEKNLVAVMPEGALPFRIDGDFYVPRTITLNPEIVMFVEIKKGNDVLFKSIPHVFTLIDTGKTEGADIIGAATETVREECRAELAESLETATGENHDNKTWEELNNTVSTLPITSEEQTQALGDWDLIKAYFADYTGGWHSLFRNAPTDNTGANKEYRLPYIYTPKMAWAERNCYISTNLLEFGVDVSSAVNLGGGTNVNTFQPLPKLQKLTLTGNENSPSLQYFMYRNSALRYLKMDTPSEEVLKANPKYYETAFHSCSGLVTVDCELDFTGQTSTKNMFNGCENLRGLRIKPFTLTCSLDVKACKYFIHPELMDISLISILNAIPNPEFDGQNAGITITYSNECWVLDTMGNGDLFIMEIIGHEVYFNPETKLYSWEKQTENSEKTTLFEAFMDRKGVTLAQ